MLEKYRHSHFSLTNSNKDRCCTDIIEKKMTKKYVLINSDNSQLLSSDGAEKTLSKSDNFTVRTDKLKPLLTPAYAVRTTYSDMCKKKIDAFSAIISADFKILRVFFFI